MIAFPDDRSPAPPGEPAPPAPAPGQPPLPAPVPAHPLASESARKLLHVVAAGAAAAVVWVFPPNLARGILLGTAVLAVAIDLGRLLLPRPGRAFDRAVGTLLRAPERRRLTGATMLAIGGAAAALLFPRSDAVYGLLCAGLADAAGAVTGRALGRHRWARSKSLEGSLAFVACAFLVGWALTGLPPARAALAALALAALEALPLPVDDNLSLPPAGAALAFLLSGAL